MELTNEFVVGIGLKEAWSLLTDVERIAPCMPGAELQEVEGENYRGVVKVKVGPITAQYKGKATFVERDEEGYRAVLRAEGRETRGQGNANATITASLVPEGEGTRVSVVTDLTITGRAAQFGRGVLADVSSKLMGQFVSCLETNLLSGDGGAPAAEEAPAGASDAAQAAPATQAGPRQVEYRPAEPVDLLEAAGAPVAKRLAPVVLGLVIVWWVRRLLRRGRA
jgi:carbon monoxide dehydrogenase subunit G